MNTASKVESEVVQDRGFFRHMVATIAYRGGKALRNAPESFASFRAGDTSRNPAQILAHMADLAEWTLRLAEGKEQWREAWRPVAPGAWNSDVARFFDALERLDAFFATPEPCAMPMEILFQGPISDMLTHIGQIAMLRRIAGSPVKGEVMILSEIQIGRVGPDQTAPKWEFD